MRNSLIKEITSESEVNPNIYIMTGDLGYNVLDVFWNKYPQRFINAGISEQNMMSVAGGLGLENDKCVFVYSIGNFSTLRCLEQIRNDVCYPRSNVKIIGLGAGFAYGDLGMSHHATEDIACMRSMPNLEVFSPSDPIETTEVTKYAIAHKGPVYIRLGRGKEPNIHELDSCLNITNAVRLKCGEKICIFTTGAISVEAVQAADELEGYGINVSVFDFPQIKPIDKKIIIKEALNNKLLISLEEGNIDGGFGGIIAEVLSEIPENHAVLKRFGLNNTFTTIVGDNHYLRHYYKMDREALVEFIKRVF